LTGFSERLKFEGPLTWLAGIISGLFGGLVGNQGGVRSAALLGFDLDRDEFVATATGIALIVDVVRMPVYLATQSSEVTSIWQYILIATMGVVIGTLGGRRILQKLPESVFKKTVAAIILAIGIFVLIRR
jgi:uncharacterized membrane protein YfcA